MMEEVRQVFDATEYEGIVDNYRCAGCWGHLTFDFAEDRMYEVFCPKCGRDRGLVTKHYVERMRNEDSVRAYEARKNMAKHLEWLNGFDQTAEQSLKELGF